MTKYRKQVVCSKAVRAIISKNEGVTPKEMRKLIWQAFPLWENPSHPMHRDYIEVVNVLLSKYKGVVIAESDFEDPT